MLNSSVSHDTQEPLAAAQDQMTLIMLAAYAQQRHHEVNVRMSSHSLIFKHEVSMLT